MTLIENDGVMPMGLLKWCLDSRLEVDLADRMINPKRMRDFNLCFMDGGLCDKITLSSHICDTNHCPVKGSSTRQFIANGLVGLIREGFRLKSRSWPELQHAAILRVIREVIKGVIIIDDEAVVIKDAGLHIIAQCECVLFPKSQVLKLREQKRHSKIRIARKKHLYLFLRKGSGLFLIIWRIEGFDNCLRRTSP